MVYISGGSIAEKRSWLRISIISDIFWAIVNFIVVFFESFVKDPLQPQKKNNFSSGTRLGGSSWGGGPGGGGGGGGGGGAGPKRPMGSIKGLADKSQNVPCAGSS